MQGRLIAQRYKLLDPLGHGGMGTVWRAKHLELGSTVAIKLINEAVATAPAAQQRFRREARAAANKTPTKYPPGAPRGFGRIFVRSHTRTRR